LTQISRESKGVGPLGRRAGMKVLPEKGRQGAVSGVRRALEGGKRSCSPSKVLVGAKEACFLNPKAEQTVFSALSLIFHSDCSSFVPHGSGDASVTV